MTFKEFLAKYNTVVVGLVGLIAAGTSGKLTDLYKDYEHLSMIHAAAAFLIVVLSYLLYQVSQLPSVAKHIEEHSKELRLLAQSYGEMVAINKAASEDRKKLLGVLEKLERTMEKAEDKQADINERLARLEGYRNGRLSSG